MRRDIALSGQAATEASDGFPALLKKHRTWLSRRGLLEKRWLILGSAPDPTTPARLPADVTLVCVKASARSAKLIGLPPPDLTFLVRKASLARSDELTPNAVLAMRRRHTRMTRLKQTAPFLGFKEFDLLKTERDAFVLFTLGSLFDDRGGEEQRPSNGVALICYAAALGVPQVIVAGISLDSDGYAYDRDARTRRHTVEDRAALSAIAERLPQVVTTEAGLHRSTGIRLLAV